MHNKRNITYTLIVNICRLLLSLVLIVSGFVKVVDPVGFMYKLQEYTSAFSISILSDDWLLFFAIVQAALEFLMGVFMLMGVYRKFISVLAFSLMLVFTVFTSYVYIADPVDDCGCFGDAYVFTNEATFVKNIILLLLATVVFLGRRRFVRNISAKSRWMVVIYSFFYIAIAEGLSLSALPVLDFRPYAIGNNLREGGVKTGQAALPSDFSIVDWETDNDAAPVILADTGYVCIVAMEFVEKASVSRVDKINDLYDYCVENNVPFYAATASGESEIELWRRRTGAEYPIYWADNMMLRTMVRSNPGVVLLKNGVVVGKWSSSVIPDIESYYSSPTRMPDSLRGAVDAMRGWRFWMLWLVVPLSVIALLDVLLARSKRKKAADAVPAGSIQKEPEEKEQEEPVISEQDGQEQETSDIK